MDSDEGSVFVEGVDDDDSEDTTSEESTESTQEQAADDTQVEGDEGDSQDKQSTLDKQKDQDSENEPELTEKGTKLAANPLERANQILANERAKIREYEEVLQNPILLKSYLAKMEPSDKKEEKVEPEMRIEDIQTTEDLQKYQKQQDDKLNGKLKELDTTIEGVRASQRDTVIADSIQSDILTVRETYPELDPKMKDGKPTNPDYNPELDIAVGQLYERMDYDKASKSFKGSVSLKEIADIVMKAAGASEKVGSVRAQTQIRDKRTGRPISGASKAGPDEKSMSAGALIASRIKAAKSSR